MDSVVAVRTVAAHYLFAEARIRFFIFHFRATARLFH